MSRGTQHEIQPGWLPDVTNKIDTVDPVGGGLTLKRTPVSSSPYMALVTDHILCIDTSGVAVTINLPAAATAAGIYTEQ